MLYSKAEQIVRCFTKSCYTHPVNILDDSAGKFRVSIEAIKDSFTALTIAKCGFMFSEHPHLLLN